MGHFDLPVTWLGGHLAQTMCKLMLDIQLTVRDTGGCTCNPHNPDPNRCMYHYAASKQPENHKIPWNCPTYFDGCNCDEN